MQPTVFPKASITKFVLPIHGNVQYDYKPFFLPYNFGHLYSWTFTISKIVTQASLVEISDKTFAVYCIQNILLDSLTLQTLRLLVQHVATTMSTKVNFSYIQDGKMKTVG